jgi:GNAT superfamily N-acetyltransferase
MALVDVEREVVCGDPRPSIRTTLLETETRSLDRLDELEWFLIRLDRDTRCRRFGHAATDEVLRSHAAKALVDAACVIGLYAGGDLRGVLEIYACAPLQCVEVALVVEPAWRRRGFGWSLLRAAMRWACDAKEPSLRLIFTRDNWAMRGLTGKAGARLDLALGEISADINPLRTML